MDTLFITNPNAGPVRTRRLLDDLIAEQLGSRIGFSVRPWSFPEELDDIVERARDDGWPCICAVGGDGTVSAIGSRLAGSETALGILPAGSGNGLARHLGIPRDPRLALDVIVSGRTERIDTAVVNGEKFLGVCGVGFDAVVAHRFAAQSSRGLRTYVVEGFRTWISYQCAPYEITVDDEQFSEEALLIAVANSGQYGNDARVAPLASLQDGLLDLAILRSASLLEAPLLLRQLFNGTFHESKRVRTRQGSQIRIARTSEGPAHLDGEPRIMPAELEFAIVPCSLTVVVPRTTGRL